MLSTGLIGCEFVAKSMTSLMSQFANTTREKIEIDFNIVESCPQNFIAFAEILKELNKLNANKGPEQKPTFFISEEKDIKVLTMVSDYKLKIEKINTPQNDEEKIYSAVVEERAKKEIPIAREEFAKELDKAFPQLMKTCRDSVKKSIEECNSKFSENFMAAADCKDFYKKRTYWEILKTLDSYQNMPKDEYAKLKEEFEKPFEEELKRKASELEETKR